jgi:hypothetical protein
VYSYYCVRGPYPKTEGKGRVVAIDYGMLKCMRSDSSVMTADNNECREKDERGGDGLLDHPRL